jgi:hypothetical protein
MSPNGTSELNQNLDPNGRFRSVAAIACRPAPGQNGLPDPLRSVADRLCCAAQRGIPMW